MVSGGDIQIIIASVLFLTAIINVISLIFSLRAERKQKRLDILNELVMEYRGLRSNKKVIFDFYEYLCILLFDERVDIDVCYNYFFRKKKLSKIYLDFMKSNLFKSSDDRAEKYPFLTILFNSFGLSIKKIGY